MRSASPPLEIWHLSALVFRKLTVHPPRPPTSPPNTCTLTCNNKTARNSLFLLSPRKINDNQTMLPGTWSSFCSLLSLNWKTHQHVSGVSLFSLCYGFWLMSNTSVLSFPFPPSEKSCPSGKGCVQAGLCSQTSVLGNTPLEKLKRLTLRLMEVKAMQCTWSSVPLHRQSFVNMVCIVNAPLKNPGVIVIWACF